MNIVNFLKWVTYSAVLLGALNWGLVGMFNFDLVSFIFGEMSTITRIIYMLIGLSAIGYLIFSIRDNCECTTYQC